MILDVVGLTTKNVESTHMPNIQEIAQSGDRFSLNPVFPAVTSTVQSSILSGVTPSKHGIISNGLYDRISHSISFWEQSDGLVQSKRIWDILKSHNPFSKTAILFFQNSMFCNSDIVVSPRPLHMENELIQWCYSKPV